MRWFNVNEFRTRLHQPWFGSRIGAVLVALAGVCLLLFPFGKGLRDWSYDLPFLLRLQKGFHTNIVIIYLDEKTYRQLGQAPYDFDRGLHAQLLQNLKTNQARMAVFDLLFIDTNRSPTLG